MTGEKTVVNTRPGKTLAYRAKKLILTNWQLWVLMLPAVVATFIFNYVPMYGIQIAFKNYKIKKGIMGSAWVGLKYFRMFLGTPSFWVMLRNTLALSLFQLALFPVNVIAALMINELRSAKYKKAVQMISYAPHFMSVVVICGMIKLFFAKDNGIVNNLIAMMGGARVDYLSSGRAFRYLYVFSGIWQDLGWGTIIYLAALSNVSQEQVEAALIDGASRLQIILHVNVPHILPTAIILFVMAAGRVLTVGYEKILLLQNNLNLDCSQVFSTYTYKVGLQGGEYSLSTTVDLFNCVVNIIVLTLVNLVTRRLSGVSLW
ncbi:MAG: sugar ABC transporter permease [Clostridia bacterium]|nr:sugar ABC transporter permease [Clostridia bacterium]